MEADDRFSCVMDFPLFEEADDDPPLVCQETPTGEQQCSFQIPEGSAAWYAARAEWALAAGDHEGAVTALDSVIARVPKDTHARALRGYALAQTGELAQAMWEFREALRIDGRDPEVYFQRAAVKGRLGDHRGTAQDLRRAIEIDDGDFRFYRLLTAALGSLGEYERASSAAEMAVDTAGDQCPDCYRMAGLLRIAVRADRDGGCRYLSRAGELGDEEAYEHIRDRCR